MPPRRRGGRYAGTSFEPPARTPPQHPGAVDYRELQWQRKWIVPLAERLGLWVWFDVDPKRNKPGWPDLFILGPRGAAWRENKKIEGKGLRSEQSEVITRMRTVGLNADVWWLPDDWNSGKIQNDLHQMARRGPEPVDLVSETGKMLYLATLPQREADKAALLWDAGLESVNRPRWRNEARGVMRRAVELALPQTPGEVGNWLLRNQLKPTASPAEVLGAVIRLLNRQNVEDEED